MALPNALRAWPALALGLGLLGSALPAHAQAPSTRVIDLTPGQQPTPAIRIAFDSDDDDQDGVPDGREDSGINSDDILKLTLLGVAPTAVVRTEGPARLLVDGRPASSVAASDEVVLQGLAPSARVNDAALVVTQADRAFRVPINVVGMRFLGAQNEQLNPAQDVLGVSRRITHDRSLPRSVEASVTSDDPENVRIELIDASETAKVTYALVTARAANGKVRDTLRHVPLHRVGESAVFRSGFLRLVTDTTDESAPEVADQVLRVSLRDRVTLKHGDGRAPLTHDLFVGRAGAERDERSVLRGKLRISLVRLAPDGDTALGEDLALAEQLAREQVVIANEIWAQCFIDFGKPEDTEVRVVDPPPPALLAISDVDGLPAAGDGQIRFLAGDRRIGPVQTEPHALPEQTARAIVQALEKAGLSGRVSLNPRAERGAGKSADVIVSDARGRLLGVRRDGQAELTTDTRQRLTIGRVDLRDGIQEFDNDVSAGGTLEERTLVKLIVDRDPETIDVLLINRFVTPERQGEAFIESDESDMANVLIFDRNAVRFQRQAWVQAHELGHILLDEPFHPDNLGPDRSYLLMDSDARQGRVTGPKRLSDAECKRARRRSGPGGRPVLLRPISIEP